MRLSHAFYYTEPMHIVPATHSDIRMCARYISDMDPWQTLRISLLEIQHVLLLACSAGNLFVYREDAFAAAIADFRAGQFFARGGYVNLLAVHPDYRRRGIGARLMDFVESRVAECVPHLYLCVSSFNVAGQVFYFRRGYTKVGEIPGLIRPEFSEWLLRKKVGSDPDIL